MARYTKCPFYIDDNKLTISCEDVVRLFDSQDSKLSHMDAYCDHEWENCKYANALNKAYDALEKGDKQALEKQKIKSLESEIKSNLIKIGKMERKIREQNEKIDNLVSSNRKMLEARKREHQRRMKLEKDLAYAQGKVADDILKITKIYEDRIAYLMDTYTGGTLNEADVEEWAKGIEYAITYETKPGPRVWKVVKRSEDGSKSDKDIQAKANKKK